MFSDVDKNGSIASISMPTKTKDAPIHNNNSTLDYDENVSCDPCTLHLIDDSDNATAAVGPMNFSRATMTTSRSPFKSIESVAVASQQIILSTSLQSCLPIALGGQSTAPSRSAFPTHLRISASVSSTVLASSSTTPEWSGAGTIE